jgi:hypothetical protein
MPSPLLLSVSTAALVAWSSIVFLPSTLQVQDVGLGLAQGAPGPLAIGREQPHPTA